MISLIDILVSPEKALKHKEHGLLKAKIQNGKFRFIFVEISEVIFSGQKC